VSHSEMIGKECFKCGKSKALCEFYLHPKMADGHLGKCKECTKSDAHANRWKNIDDVRAFDRSPSRAGGQRVPRGYHKKYFERFPNRLRAKNIVIYALR
jgi:hypothetical protein